MTATTKDSIINERNFRPQRLEEFIGQKDLKRTLRLMLDASKTRGALLEHVVFFGAPGLGKTTLAGIIASEQGTRLHELSAPSIARPGDLAQVLIALQKGDVFFLDEIHALKRESSELLYSAMEDFKVSIKTETGDRPLTLAVYPFTLVGATTDFGILPDAMRSRFGHSFYLKLYTLDELTGVILRAADTLGYMMDDEALAGIAVRSRGTPRTALRLFRRCVDAATNANTDLIDASLVENTMPLLGLDKLGLEDADRKYLATLAITYKGGPVGPRSIAANAGIDLATVEQVIEPVLLTSGLIARTPRGRRITRAGYEHVKTFLAAPPAINWRKVENTDVETGDELNR
ncbi:MAG: Holliday junction branch migration DNA helicase RuvB [Chloroflexi bacterium]|nr:Holliday junction branch migration DNA helicase RuvB [Chloroflexota bacterium]MBI3340803.1 Holliday junction branch migration DNA helicase RuvB [Chloroflexota bacterium]